MILARCLCCRGTRADKVAALGARPNDQPAAPVRLRRRSGPRAYPERPWLADFEPSEHTAAGGKENAAGMVIWEGCAGQATSARHASASGETGGSTGGRACRSRFHVSSLMSRPARCNRSCHPTNDPWVDPSDLCYLQAIRRGYRQSVPPTRGALAGCCGVLRAASSAGGRSLRRRFRLGWGRMVQGTWWRALGSALSHRRRWAAC